MNGYAVALTGGSFVNLGTQSWATGNAVDVSLTNLNRFIAVPYTSATTTSPSLTVSYRNGSSSACSASQIVITNAAGKVLTAASACGTTTTQTVTATDTASIGGSGQFYIFYTRVSDSAGALRVWGTSLSK